MEPVLNEALIDYESGLWLKAVKIKLSFPQQIVEEHEYVRDTTHPPKHYGCIPGICYSPTVRSNISYDL